MTTRLGVPRSLLLLTLLGVGIGSPPALAQKAPQPKQKRSVAALRVTISNIRSTRGVIRVSLFASSQGFPNDYQQAHRILVTPAARDEVQVAFESLAPGTYAVAVIHDENNNGALDTGWFGIPKEGFGASNNPKPKRRPPTFAEARFAFTPEEAAITIRLIHL